MRYTDEDLTKLIREANERFGLPIPVAREIVNRYAITRKASFHLGTTGSRYGLPDAQHFGFTNAIMVIASVWFSALGKQNSTFHLHHGCATGADSAAHYSVRLLTNTVIHGHPGVNHRGEAAYRMPYTEYNIMHPEKPYLARNADIVSFANALVAAPQYEETHPKSAHSGTWQTIRLARKASIPILIVWPDGRTERDKTTEGKRLIPWRKR